MRSHKDASVAEKLRLRCHIPSLATVIICWSCLRPPFDNKTKNRTICHKTVDQDVEKVVLGSLKTKVTDS